MKSLFEHKLRIAQVAPLWTRIPPAHYGGIELLMKLLCDELVAHGHEVTLFGSGDCHTAAKLHPVIRENLSEMMAQGEALMSEYYMSAAISEALMQQDQFDVIHCHLSTGWLPVAATARKPCLFTLHTSPHADDLWALGKFPQVPVAGISHAQVHAAELKLHRKIPVVYNGVDFESYEPSYEEGRYLVFLGRMSPEKNPLGAIRTAQALDMPIILAGQPQNSSEEEYFQNEIEPLLDDEMVRWIGPVNHPQKVELLRHASALLFPIQWEEPFGLVMIEAMACGTPVVAHSRGSVEEVVDPGITGFHATSLDALPDLIPQAISLNRRHVRDHARERFGHRKMVADYLDLYQSLCGQTGE